MSARHAAAGRPARGFHSRAFRFKSHVSRPSPSTPEAHSTPSPAPSRVDIEMTVGDEVEESGPSGTPGASTSGRHPSLSLAASLEPSALEECALLVMIYNLERRRAELLAGRVLHLFERNPELAKACEATLPGLTLRLQRNPEGACEALSSFEVLFKILRVVDRDQAAGLEEDAKAMVSLHASGVGSRTREAMRSLPETPMWQSIFWKATNTIVGWDVLRSLTEGAHEASSAGDGVVSVVSDRDDKAVLRLRCNSKTAGQGLPLTVSVRIEVRTSDELRHLLAERLSGSYFGKSLAHISTSVWTSLRLSREADVSGMIRLGNMDDSNVEIQVASMDDLDAVTMALAYLTADGGDGSARRGRRSRPDGTPAVRDTWVPADARIRFARSRGAPGASTYRVSVDDVASTIHGQVVDGLIDVLDAVRAIDPLFIAIV